MVFVVESVGVSHWHHTHEYSSRSLIFIRPVRIKVIGEGGEGQLCDIV